MTRVEDAQQRRGRRTSPGRRAVRGVGLVVAAVTLACESGAPQRADAAGVGSSSAFGGAPPVDVLPGDTVGVVLAAGDVATCGSGAERTARQLAALHGTIIVLGDAAYASRSDPDPYRTCYDSTWGRFRGRTRSVMGNHDAAMRDAYFAYFREAAGPRPGGYYSFEAGPWHVLALNSTIDVGPSSPQMRWVSADLAAHRTRCTLAVMHHPRFSSGPHADEDRLAPLWSMLARAGVDVVVAAHDHIYERFAPMNAGGDRDPGGVRLFVVGTGGAPRYRVARVARNSEARSAAAHGVLRLTLFRDRYGWEFIPAARSTFRDAGSGTCN